MRIKNWKIIKKLLISFSFVMAFLFFGGQKVSAGSTDLYFEDIVALGTSEYDSDGNIVIREQLKVYAYNNGAGRQIDPNHLLKIEYVTVEVGSESKNFSGTDTKYVASITNGQKPDYLDVDAKYVDLVVLNIKNMLDEFSLANTNNNIYISFKFQYRTRPFYIYGAWKDYNQTVNYYKVSGSYDGKVPYDRSHSTFLLDALDNAQVNIQISNQFNCKADDSNSECYYNIQDSINKRPLNLKVTLPFKISGKMTLKINHPYESIDPVIVQFNNSNTATINLINTLPIDDREVVYVITGIQLSGVKDKYGANVEENKDIVSGLNHKVTIATVKPKVISAGVIQPLNGNNEPVSVLYDVYDVPVKFVTTDSKSTLTIDYLYFKIADKEIPIQCNCSPNNSDQLTISVQLSGNGKVELVGLTGTIIDKYGNSKTYNSSSNTGISFVNEQIELVSSIEDITTDRDYYYYGETVTVDISMKSAIIYEKIILYITSPEGTVTEKKYTNTSVVNSVSYVVTESMKSGTYLSKIELYRKDNDTDQYIKVYTKNLSVYLNTYFDLAISPQGEVIDEKMVITNPAENKIKLHDIAVEEFSDYYASSNKMICAKESDNFVYCQYDSDAQDNVINVIIVKGNIILTNGQRNNRAEFNVIINTRVPSVENTIMSSNLVMLNDSYYYNNYTSAIEFELNDGTGGDELCVHYTFDDSLAKDKFIKLCSGSLIIDAPSEIGIHTLRYFVSDGINQSDIQTYPNKFILRNEFELGDLEIKINDIDISDMDNEMISDNYYNYVSIDYKNAEGLLNKFDIELKVTNVISASSSLLSDTFSFNKDIYGLRNVYDVVSLKLILTDKIGNKYVKNVQIGIDTINPTFENIIVENTSNNGSYTVKINGYEDNIVKVVLDGVETDIDSTYSFNTLLTKYTMVLIDSAGNRNEKVFTTISPVIEFNELSKATYDIRYELYISPFDSSIHIVEDYKYLVFAYTTEQISPNDIEVARNNVCTTGRTVKCYKSGSYVESNATISQTFAKGYTYIILVKVNNILVKEAETNELPRINVAAPDLDNPTWGYLSEDTNPDYISSVSGEKFSFKFLASDLNLSDTFYYLVVDKSKVNTMNTSKFYELYKTCYGSTVDTNGCGVYGEVAYKEEVENNVYLADVVLEANYNTKRRLKNNVVYALYVLLSDDSSNVELFKVREFTNIIESSIIKYKNDSNQMIVVEDGEEVSTVNTSAFNVSRYKNIDIREVKVDGTAITCLNNECNYTLSTGKYNIEVTDVLGNKATVTIYSATANNPVIDVYYEYNGDYFKILDNSFAYNTSNASKVYVKVSGSDIHTIKITMNTTKTYASGSVMFDDLTDDISQYGVSLLEIMNQHNGSQYSGNVTITAINNRNGETPITLLVDNELPQITLVPIGSKLDLLGETPSTLEFDNIANEYEIAFNYQRDLTYSYLMNALSLKVDGIDFNNIIKNNRFKFKIDGNIFNSYEESITKGTKKITIDYFDNAGNEATTFKINITCIDNEKPSLSLSEVVSTVEVNEVVRLAQVFISDNHDSNQDLVLKVTIGGNEIDYTNYKFDTVGDYTVVYTLTDTSNQTTTYTQTIIVKDTTPPVLKEGTEKRYQIGLDVEFAFELPQFLDLDGTVYTPYEIIMYDTYDQRMDDSKANYPLSISFGTLRLRFIEGYDLGTYKIKFVAKDGYANVCEEIFEIILKDSGLPEFEVKVNNINVDNGGSLSLPLGSNINVDYSAYDDYDGELTNNVMVKVLYNGEVVNGIDSNKSGEYSVVLSVKDSAENTATYTITIFIKKDEILPVLNKVSVNNIDLLDDVDNKIRGNSISFNVDASDDSNGVFVEIKVNDSYTLKNGEFITVESDVYGVVYEVEVIVKDTSNNSVSKKYRLILDNKAPAIVGFENASIYLESVDISVTDENIELIEIYVDGILKETSNVNLGHYTLSSKGIYRIVAKDTHGNESVKTFALLEENKFSIMDNENNEKGYNYDIASLVKVDLDGNKVTFYLKENNSISSYDNVYLLVNYPYSNSKYVAYQMNGETYLVNDYIKLEQSIIEGIDNEDVLEKIGDDYYAYIMVVKNNNVANNDTNNNPKDNTVLKGIISSILIVLGVGLIVFLIIKFRRRVRAI